MTQILAESTSAVDFVDARRKIQETIHAHDNELWNINQKIHSNPELAYEEHKAHDNITSLLQELGFSVTPHAHGLATSFVAEYGTGGRVVAFNAEYDALPGIGHACGHNLIAMMSIASFLGLAEALKTYRIPGRVRLIGTPAEEGAGGKLKIIDAGGFRDVDACLMTHPGPPDACAGFTGDAYMPTLANHKSRVRFTGKPAHAAVAPWEGVNALDAAVLAYNGISALRQQIHPVNRVHCVVSEGGERPNVIPGTAAMECYVRSPTLSSANDLLARVKRCFDGASLQTGCEVDVQMINTYADLRPNPTICRVYADEMAIMGSEVKCDLRSSGVPGSTDQGNVSYECPAFQAYVAIPAEPGCKNHTPGFTAVAGTREAHDLCIAAAKGMALVGWKVLADDNVALKVKSDFKLDQTLRDQGRDPRSLEYMS
ncbi:hypothetical protein BO78DRAFT_469151 [Aspergillus sclerotiicarbonarius CBS 121057]|uniref:Peptidase M20 domain-containing protein 2 n=1 Tax=Aspergillus sclerotiicarbonarius (strain CBS 121057 / IBT 28362) TaxID=1448318 RepID=A0A319ED22_ASPSB|nr:hypothetical protein BO78DRAFT_469151 [Aspergillus sclerotiicarbonarius CBS 121057]